MAVADLDALLRQHLLGPASPTSPAGRPGYSGPVLVALVGPRIYMGADLPAGYRPVPGEEAGAVDVGPALLIQVRIPAGPGPIRRPEILAASYGATPDAARLVSQALYARLQDAATASFRRLWLGVAGEVTTEPEPRFWPVVRDTYRAIIVG